MYDVCNIKLRLMCIFGIFVIFIVEIDWFFRVVVELLVFFCHFSNGRMG